MAPWQYWLVVSGLVVWELYWIISALGVKRAASKEPLLSRLPVVIALGLGLVCLVAPWWLSGVLAQAFLPQGGIFFYVGEALQLSGLALAFWARATLGRNWSGRVTIKEDHELVMSGPYRRLRHPIYSGALLAVTGAAIALGWYGALVTLVLFTGVFVRKILMEEKVLTQHFGDAYVQYRKKTDALILFVW